MMPKWGDRPSRWYSRLFSSPARVFWTLTAVSGVAYVPMVLAFGSVRWTACGPFMFQTSRLPHYAVWFFAGLFTGAHGINRGVIAPDGALAQNWLRWLGWASAAFAVLVVVTHPAIRSTVPPWWELVVAVAWVLSCTATTLWVDGWGSRAEGPESPDGRTKASNPAALDTPSPLKGMFQTSFSQCARARFSVTVQATPASRKLAARSYVRRSGGR